MNEIAKHPPSALAHDALATQLDVIAGQLNHCLLSDRAQCRRQLKRLRSRLRKLERGQHPPAGIRRDTARLQRACATSCALVKARTDAEVHLEYSPELPVSRHREALKRLIVEHQVVVVSGETGSGKSTQLPKLCLELGRGVVGRIGHTQPRRIAARAIARRLAEETATAEGEVVGHCVRFDERLAPQARVKVMTDGILLNEIHTDRWLRQYDTIIIDEVHERSLNIDVLLGYLKGVLARRPELKLIITSATLDVAAFQVFYLDCAAYEIPGRGYPVEIRYRPLDDGDCEDDEQAEEQDVYVAIVEAVRELDRGKPGDVLIFLPDERNIKDAHKALTRAQVKNT